MIERFKLKTAGGTSSSYLTAHIGRDNPTIPEAMKARKNSRKFNASDFYWTMLLEGCKGR
jgi:hypothetical protein